MESKSCMKAHSNAHVHYLHFCCYVDGCNADQLEAVLLDARRLKILRRETRGKYRRKKYSNQKRKPTHANM